ncbi:MAG: cellobiose phosphorylase [bacterium]
MKKPLWKFTDDAGTFTSESADHVHSLYFPLCNSAILSSITPDLHGDIKTDQNSFLMQPVSRIDLHNIKSSRNFWIYINPQKIWSAAGVSKDIRGSSDDSFSLEAGLLWHKTTRQNKSIGLKSQITSFVPSSNEPVEIMNVTITNISLKPISFIPTAAIPLYARSAENFRDHRQVTSLLHRIEKAMLGIIVTPTLLFNESGHTKNNTSYFVYGIDERSAGPEHIYAAQEEFTGIDSDLEKPSAIYNNVLPESNSIQGKEAMGGLRFASQNIMPNKSKTFIILMGIVQEKMHIPIIINKFDTPKKIYESFEKTKQFWHSLSSTISISTGDNHFDNFFRWVSIQPFLRKTFGCSFLPDFDYGKGGRGWRDLWQDSLALILTRPESVKSSLINNLSGIRIDGTNATIIGKNEGEFIADRNNISRVWMDHGVWPLLTIQLYIQQTGDISLLLTETSYFKDHQSARGKNIDTRWKPDQGIQLTNKDNHPYKGSILEHLLVQNLVQFFNVGPHNHVRLENADWNDGFDLAYENGESVAFSSMYAYNLRVLCELIRKSKLNKISICNELSLLLDTLDTPVNYSNAKSKQVLLKKYFSAVTPNLSGEKLEINTSALIKDLTKKADWISKHIQQTEWLKEGFFNGYYDNNKKRVEGTVKGVLRMTLAGQTFPILSGIAAKKQIKSIIKNIHKYLKDQKLGGIHLNTDFKEEQLALGRAFSFAYGNKENGAFFNHMIIMYAYALYKENCVTEAYDIINSIYTMVHDTEKSLIYPGLPEYFNNEGRGMYSYLTGSASWYILTLVTQMFGVRGEYGDLLIEPKLTKDQFKSKHIISITTTFAEKPLQVTYINSHRKDFGEYVIKKASLNSKIISNKSTRSSFVIARSEFLRLTNNNSNTIDLILD